MRSAAATALALRLLAGVAFLAAGGEARREPRGADAEALREQRLRVLQQVQVGASADSPADCGRHPYVVSLRDKNNTHVCSGVLINQSMVLTSARCVKKPEEDRQYLAVVGACSLEDSLNKTNEGGLVEVFLTKQVIVHENWTGNTEDGYDIAVMELDGSSTRPHVSLISAGAQVRTTDQVAVVGWGQDSAGSAVERLQLLRDVQVINNGFCDGESAWPFIKPSMICTTSTFTDVCRGDHGAPLIELFAPGGDPSGVDPKFDILVGITSFGDDEAACDAEKRPDVYTRISDMREWIDDKIASLRVTVRPVAPAIVANSALVEEELQNGTAATTNGTTGAKNETGGETGKDTSDCALCYKQSSVCFFCGS